MKSAVIGFPRIGKLRELKFASEKYFKKEINEEQLQQEAKKIRIEQWNLLKEHNITYISSNDYSFYDNMLDLAVLINAIPKEYKQLQLSNLDTYFAMARGYQGENGDVKALAMKKWFNTNYHYLVPELEDDTIITLKGTKPFDEYREAKQAGINTKVTLIGGFTFLQLATYRGKKRAIDFVDDIVKVYIDIIQKLETEGGEWIQFEEPCLVKDLTKDEIEVFVKIYEKILSKKGKIKVLLQTYFGDIRDCYSQVITLPFDGIGLDFIEGKKSLTLLQQYGFPEKMQLYAGVVNGKNIWKNNYKETIQTLREIQKYASEVVISTSCSLLHVPYTLDNEGQLSEEIKQYFSFAVEKLEELKELALLQEKEKIKEEALFRKNQEIFSKKCQERNQEVWNQLASLKESDFRRDTPRELRKKIQKDTLRLPILPTTTIGSFPQTAEVKENRKNYKIGKITAETYRDNVKKLIQRCIKKQEEWGLDVLVHGEYERNDMVEFFGENLDGFIFTEKAWVQSYGTRCVKPPIIFGDVSRKEAFTVDYIKYAQSLTDKPVKGMLTGPVTILNWSFPREELSFEEMTFQIALAIREEVKDLEAAGIRIIQIDEAALKEKLPIRREDWHKEYLDIAIKAFRLCNAKIKAETQIHTHMCYSEFDDIVKEIDQLDADVISFEAARSKLKIIDVLKANKFQTEVGPGVYDIHSPRVPSVEEIKEAIEFMLGKMDQMNLWINPDCGLKTRGEKETEESLINLVKATKLVRQEKQLNN